MGSAFAPQWALPAGEAPVDGCTVATLPGRSFKPPPPTSNLSLILHSTAKSDNVFSAPKPGTELYSLQSTFIVILSFNPYNRIVVKSYSQISE